MTESWGNIDLTADYLTAHFIGVTSGGGILQPRRRTFSEPCVSSSVGGVVSWWCMESRTNAAIAIVRNGALVCRNHSPAAPAYALWGCSDCRLVRDLAYVFVVLHGLNNHSYLFVNLGGMTWSACLISCSKSSGNLIYNLGGLLRNRFCVNQESWFVRGSRKQKFTTTPSSENGQALSTSETDRLFAKSEQKYSRSSVTFFANTRSAIFSIYDVQTIFIFLPPLSSKSTLFVHNFGICFAPLICGRHLWKPPNTSLWLGKSRRPRYASGSLTHFLPVPERAV